MNDRLRFTFPCYDSLRLSPPTKRQTKFVCLKSGYLYELIMLPIRKVEQYQRKRVYIFLHNLKGEIIMKKGQSLFIATIILAILFSLWPSITVRATSQAQDDIRIMVDGVFVYFEDIPPQMSNNRVLVPVRGVFEHLGFVVDWIPQFRMATLANNYFFIEIPTGGNYFIVNGRQVFPDVPQQLISDRLMLPLRAIAEAVGGTAIWDMENQIAIIITQAGENQDQTHTTTPALTTTPTPPTTTPFPTLTPGGNVDVIEATVFDELSLLSNEELLTLIENAPSHFDTRSSMILPGRMLTQSELYAWIDEYRSLGGVNAYELEIIRLINEVRVRYGLNPLALSPELSMAARFHSQEQVDLDFFGHESPVTGRGTQRAEMFGHTNVQEHVFGVGENIIGTATSNRSPADQVNTWLNSPGHRAAILRGDDVTQAVSIGVGRVGGITTAKFGS